MEGLAAVRDLATVANQKPAAVDKYIIMLTGVLLISSGHERWPSVWDKRCNVIHA